MPDPKPTLEDLLSLKKCERPTADEWAQFDERLKSKMMRKLVREPRATGRKLSAGALAPICAAALVAVLFLPSLARNDTANPTVFRDSGISDAVSKTPLPSVGYSFSSNEMTPSRKSAETPVIAPMNAENDASVRYVSNSLPVSSGAIF